MATYTDTNTYRRDVWPVTSEEVSPTILFRAATMAYNKINSVLYGIYTVPFTATYPPEIVDISDMLTKGYALALSMERGSVSFGEESQNEFTVGMKDLEAIATGAADIISLTRLTAKTGYHNMEGYRPMFDLDSSLNHDPDVNYIDDVLTDRENT